MDFRQLDELNLPFIDEQRAKLLPRPTLNSYPRIPNNQINFGDILDQDQSQNSIESKGSKFFSQNNNPSLKQSKQELTIYLRESLGGLKARKKTVHNVPPVGLLKGVHNITIPNTYPETLKIFLESDYFLYFIKIVVILNLVGIFLLDYSFRTLEEPTLSRLSPINAASLCLQLFANCVFTLQIAMRCLRVDHNMTDPYLLINMGGTFATWISIFFNMIEYDSNPVFTIILILRIARAILRVMEVFQCLRTPFEIFVRTVPSLQKLFFPFLIITLFYSLAGMVLYSQSVYQLCQKDQEGPPVYTGYCGSSFYTCPSGSSCVVVSELPEPASWNQFNLISFEDIFHSLLTVYHFVFVTNFSLIRGKFSSFINPYVSTLFFVSMAVFFFYIFANLIMISMSKAYMHEIDNQTPDPSQENQANQQTDSTTPHLIIKWSNLVMAISQSIIIALTSAQMSQELQNIQALLDFSFSWVSIVLIGLLMFIQGRCYFRKALNVVDLGTMGCHLLDLFICLGRHDDLIYSQNPLSLVLRGIKVLRIVRLLYISERIFSYQKFVIWVFKKTILKIKSFLLLCLCFAVMLQQIGRILFAYKIRFDSNGAVDLQGVPYLNNFESFTSSLYSVFYLFLNENWSGTMYQYYAAVGWPAVCFFVISVFAAHMMLMRLYIAVFLGYFKEELSKKSKQELIRQHNQQLTHLRDNVKRKTQNSRDHQLSNSSEDNNSPASQGGCCHWPLLSSIFHSQHFQKVVNLVILVHCLTIVVRTSSDSSQKTTLLYCIENICLAVYIGEVVLGCLIEGVYLGPQSYLKKSKSNVISMGVVLLSILAWIPLGDVLVTKYLRRCTILKVFTLFRQTDKNMTIVLDTICEIVVKFFKFIFIYALFLFIISIIPLKLLNKQGGVFNCQLNPNYLATVPINEQDCLNLGGSWLRNQNFSNVFKSLTLFYQLASSESWSVFISGLVKENKAFGWELFFITVFFVYNICFLNIMMGFIVETYMHLKDKAYNLNLLKQSQRCWVLIRNSIHTLTPRPILTLSQKASSPRQVFFVLITHEVYLTVLDYLPYLNAALYLVHSPGDSGFYSDVVQYLKNGVMFIFVVDVVIKLYTLRKNFFELPSAYTDFVSGIVVVGYTLSAWMWNPGREARHILDFVLVCTLLLRCKSLLVKYAWCKTNLNSVIDILPKCKTIIQLFWWILFVYAALGLEIFKNVKTGYVIDNYNVGFGTFLTAIITLVRVSVTEGWYEIVSAYLKVSTETDFCYDISSSEDSLNYFGQGCGSWLAYPYFLTFHAAVVLLVMNLLIATMASAYDDNYEIEYNSVNIFQLEDCLNLWQKYDPHATGVVHYKKFWRLTSQIAILFGISKKKLIKRKNKFFEELDLQIYQEKNNPILCYRFHDVITKFSKIKLQVANLSSKKQNMDNEVEIQFDISPSVLKEIKDFITPFPDHLYTAYHPFKEYKSGETKYIFALLKKLRHWKHLSTERKRIAGGTKLSSIFDIKFKKQSAFGRENFTMPSEL